MFEKVKETIVNNLGCDEEKISMEATLAEDLGIDSLDAVELVMALEDELGIKIPDEKLGEMKKVSDIVKYLEENQN